MDDPVPEKPKIHTTLGIPVCNKPHCITPLIQCVEQLRMPRSEMLLLVVDVSGNPTINKRLSAWTKEEGKSGRWGNVLYVDQPQHEQVTEYVGRSDIDRFMKKRWLVAETKNLVNNFRIGDLFFIEEDTLCPPGSYEKLRRILDEHPDVGVASGVNYSRSENSTLGNHTVWKFISNMLFPFGESIPEQTKTTATPIGEKPFGIELVGGCGNGCMLAREDIMKGYRFVGQSTISGMSGSDVNFGWYVTQLRRKLYVVDWSIKTKHLDIDKVMNVLEVYTSPHYGNDYDWNNN